MGFQLVPKLVTLNDLERRNDRVVGVISPNSDYLSDTLYRPVVVVTVFWCYATK